MSNKIITLDGLNTFLSNVKTYLNELILSKQDKLVSGENIVTVNGNSILTSDNVIAGNIGTVDTDLELNDPRPAKIYLKFDPQIVIPSDDNSIRFIFYSLDNTYYDYKFKKIHDNVFEFTDTNLFLASIQNGKQYIIKIQGYWPQGYWPGGYIKSYLRINDELFYHGSTPFEIQTYFGGSYGYGSLDLNLFQDSSDNALKTAIISAINNGDKIEFVIEKN